MTPETMRYVALTTEAVDEVLDSWHTAWPGMGVLALLPEAEKTRLPVLQAACRERQVALAGGIFPALVTRDGFLGEGAWLLCLPRRVPSFLLTNLNGGPREPAGLIAQAVEAALTDGGVAGRPTLYLIFDGLLPNIASILDGLYLHLADRVNYAGVNAGSETFQPMPCLFDAEQQAGEGVLGLLLPPGTTTVLEHGYPVPERVMIATATEGNRILSIDWRPAFEAYQEIIQAEYDISLTRDNFYQYAVHFPFGLMRANDEVVVRIPVALNEDGSLLCVGEVPENAMLVVLRAPEPGEGIPRLAGDLAATGGAGPDLLTFYCAGRRMHMGPAAEAELGQLAARTGAVRLAGALSLGEIGGAQSSGYPMFHNAALVCTPWREE